MRTRRGLAPRQKEFLALARGMRRVTLADGDEAAAERHGSFGCGRGVGLGTEVLRPVQRATQRIDFRSNFPRTDLKLDALHRL